MKVAYSTVTMMTITDAVALDPIRVITEDYEPGQGRIIITCYSKAWVGYWGGMSGRSIKEFFIDCDAGYLIGNLTAGLSQLKSREKNDNAYLIRIINAVQSAFRSGNPE